ncbi:MAG: SsrA-binding protein SmpB [Thermoanaerobaculaceae bacterium]|nr:SsrA-binding protein SmpB [Thermoanaerobaculaceae bacterium]MDI9622007.1 SsrA-binding protein SmpB [Acidobacteriota bacterium]NLH12351.1 SsrA-binding protein SmpB [Holophagae bacterium]HPW54797.1 SsrA-binding protein SmpB [Thermoanaerobaculaceae bacterium]
MKILAVNRKARFEYELLERLVVGLALLGSEVKSVRQGRVSFGDGHVAFHDGEAYLVEVHIAPYENAGYAGHDPLRRRKLLLHRRELARWRTKVTEKGLTLVPLAIGVEGNWIKVEIALARGKKLHDKRETIKQRTLDRETMAELKGKR